MLPLRLHREEERGHHPSSKCDEDGCDKDEEGTLAGKCDEECDKDEEGTLADCKKCDKDDEEEGTLA